jgi:glycosyltransferase involved in cell wall biosynthesis
MRIVFLSTLSLTYASFIGRVFPLARALRRVGHDVRIVTLHHDWPGRAFVDVVYGEVPIHYVGPMHVRGLGDARRQLRGFALFWAGAVATLQLARYALRRPADLFHVWKPHPFNGLAGLLAARLRGRPVVVDCDDYEAESSRFSGPWQQRTVRLFEDGLPRWAGTATANTRFWTTRLVETLRLPPERVAYLPNGVDPERFAPPGPAAVERLRRDLGLEGKAVAVYVGILSLAGHPLDLLLEAFARVARALPRAHLLWVGGGEDGAALRRRADELGLGARMTFAGVVPPEEVAAYYRLGQCAVDPVRDDVHARARCPLKVLESMACGVPVVTGDVGDRRELLGDGPAGLLVRPGDAAALAAGIQELLTDAEQQRRLGLAARREVERYRWDRLAGEVERFYGQVARGT